MLTSDQHNNTDNNDNVNRNVSKFQIRSDFFEDSLLQYTSVLAVSQLYLMKVVKCL